LAPVEARGEPHREGLGEVLVGVLLRVPTRDVRDVGPREGLRLELFLVGLVVVAEQRPPGRGLVEPVGVVEAVPRLVAEVHEDLALRLDPASELTLDGLERRVGQVEGDADDRNARGAAPLVAQVALGGDVDARAPELLMELVDEPLGGRARQLEPQVFDTSAEEGLPLRTQRRLRAVAGVGLLTLMEGGRTGGRRRLWP